MTTKASSDALSTIRHQLGQEPDAVLAARAGVPVSAVKALRKELGVEAYRRDPPGGEATAAPVATGSVVLRRPKGADKGDAPSRRVVEHALDKHRHLFATFSDSEIADLTDHTQAQVRAYRTSRGLGAPVEPEPAKDSRGASPLTAYLHELGKVPDAEIARRAGVSRSWVVAFRKKRGIAAFEPPVEAPAGRPASPAAKPRRVAEEGDSRVALRRRSKLDPYLHLIGVRPDSEVARLAGVTFENVRAFRKRHNLGAGSPADTVAAPGASTPAVAPVAAATPIPAAPERRKPGRKTPIDAFAHLVGTVPDAEVARLSGASLAAVSAWRIRRKIASFKGTEAAPATTVAPAPSAAPATTVAPAPKAAPPAELASPPAAPRPSVKAAPVAEAAPVAQAATAFLVRASSADAEWSFFLVAGDMLEAVQLASRALAAREGGPWRIERVRHAGDAVR